MSDPRGLYMRGKGEVPVLYLGLNFATDGLKIRAAVLSEPSLKSIVEILNLTKKQFHRKLPMGSAFLITLPLEREAQTIKAIKLIVQCIKKAYTDLELTWEADLSDSESWTYTGVVMEYRRNRRP